MSSLDADDVPYVEDVLNFGGGRVFVTDLADMDGDEIIVHSADGTRYTYGTTVASEIERLSSSIKAEEEIKHLRHQVHMANARARQNALMAEDVRVIKDAEAKRMQDELEYWKQLDEKQAQLQAMSQQPLVKKIPTPAEIDLDELGIHVELHHRIGYIVMVEQTRRTFANGYRTWWRPTRKLAERKGSSERLKDIQRDEPWQRRRGDMSDEEWRAQLDARDHYDAMLMSL